MAHAIWKGSISFGLVNIPVGLYSAEKRNEMDFTLLDRKDLSPIGYKKVSKTTGNEVAATEIVKGYEYEEGRYVLLGNEDFKRASPKATQTVEIIDFIDASDIQSIYFDKPYYLAPDRRGKKGYALLREALKRTGKAGVARVVIHTREYMGLVIPYDKVLVLNLLRYAGELKNPGELDIPAEGVEEAGVNAKELEMAERLVDGMVSKWDPGKYHDKYRQELLDYIQKKIEYGQTEKIPEAVPEAAPVRGAEVIDLMSLLKKSVEEAKAVREPRKKAAHE